MNSKEIKNILINSLRGYIEINLSKNEIVGDVIDNNDPENPVVVDLTDPSGNRFTYDAFALWWSENMLLSNREQFLEKCNCSYLISCFLCGKKTVDIVCTSKDTAGKPRELRKTYYISKVGNGDIYAICAVSDITDTIYNQQFAEIAADLSESFEGIFYINTDDNSYTALKTKGAFSNIINNLTGQDFFKNSLKHLREVVHNDDYHSVAGFLNREFLSEKLKKGNTASLIFRLCFNEKELYYRARVSNSGYDDHHIVFALENVNNFVVNEKIQNEKLMRDKRIIEALSSEYSSIYYVDLAEDSFEIYKLNSLNLPDLQESSLSGITYSEAYRKCVQEIVYEPDRESMMQAGSVYYILSKLQNRESFTVVYRSKDENGARYCEMKIARAGNDPMPRYVIIAFADNSIEKTREIEKAENINMVLQLASNFEAVFDVDIKSGSFICYSGNESFPGAHFSKAIPGNDFFKGISETADRYIYVQDRPLVKSFLTREYLLDVLKNKNDFQMDMRIMIGGLPTWYHLKVVRNKNSSSQSLIAGIFNIDEQRQNEYFHMTEVKKLTKEAQFDMLTGIRNKNAFIQYENEMDNVMTIPDESFSVVICDINDLKKINDQYGHEEGDRVIKKASALICDIFDHSPVFRIGGDEFVIVLRGRDYKNRKSLIESLRKISENNSGTGEPVIASGISDRNKNDNTFSDVFARADEDMYCNKKSLKTLLKE